jgi:hypothetical protein
MVLNSFILYAGNIYTKPSFSPRNEMKNTPVTQNSNYKWPTCTWTGLSKTFASFQYNQPQACNFRILVIFKDKALSS